MAKAKIPISVDLDTYNTITELAARENIARVKLVADHFAGRREKLLNNQAEEKMAELQKENEKLRKENEECKTEMEKTAKVLEKVSLKRQQSS